MAGLKIPLTEELFLYYKSAIRDIFHSLLDIGRANHVLVKSRPYISHLAWAYIQLYTALPIEGGTHC